MAMRLLVSLKNDMDRGRVLLFPLPNRGPKEDGDREVKVHSLELKTRRLFGRVCEVLAGSLAQWSAPGTVKSFAKNSSGHQHGTRRITARSQANRESSPIHHGDPTGCPAR